MRAGGEGQNAASSRPVQASVRPYCSETQDQFLLSVFQSTPVVASLRIGL